MDLPFALPRLAGAPDPEGWLEERARYRVRPRPRPMFKTLLDPSVLFAGGDGEAEVTTRARPGAEEGAAAVELVVKQRLGPLDIEDRYVGVREGAGARAGTLDRRVGTGRREHVDFAGGPFPWPRATYPEVLLPFLMRGQPFADGRTRAAYAWTADRFVARVYYEPRREETIEVPAGRVRAVAVRMVPDLNDWVALGAVLTKLAKPLLPAYAMWFEVAAPHRVVRFEGAYGPPGAPEVVLELC